jgi:uncharacterized membrane protein YphA (DoxX/SURF4 family)
MNRFLWVLQALLAVAFFAHGWLFLFPPAEMVEMLNSTISPAFRLFLGVAEVLAAIGLIVPGITRTVAGLRCGRRVDGDNDRRHRSARHPW